MNENARSDGLRPSESPGTFLTEREVIAAYAPPLQATLSRQCLPCGVPREPLCLHLLNLRDDVVGRLESLGA